MGLVEYATTAALNPPAGYSKFQRRMERVLEKTSASTSVGTAHSMPGRPLVSCRGCHNITVYILGKIP